MDEKKSFAEYLERRTAEDTASFFTNPAIQKSYYIGAYSYALSLHDALPISTTVIFSEFLKWQNVLKES